MRKLISLYIVFALPFFVNAQLTPTIQSPSPQVANLLSFESYPVELHTGIPDISLPIFTLQTRNQEVFENISMSYHPSGIRKDAPAGEIGKGWVLSSGGVIGRTVYGELDELGMQNDFILFNDVFEYTIPGSQGRFKLKKENNQLKAYPYDYRGEKIEIDLEIVNNKIIAITIYSAQGLKYHFDQTEAKEYAMPFPAPHLEYFSAFYLTIVSDQNNNTLLQYTYNNRLAHPNNSPIGYSYKQKASIVSPGFGSILFQYQQGSSYPDPLQKVDKVILKDVFGNTIKEATIRLDKLEISSGLGIEKETYSLKYENASLPGGATASFDKFGYPNYKPFCSVGNNYNVDGFLYGTAPDYCTNGVLNRIDYPTGGSVHFRFESNTYMRLKTETMLDSSTTPPKVKYRYVPDINPEDPYTHPYLQEYYIDTPLQTFFFIPGFNPSSSFTVSSTGTYLLSATATYTQPPGNGNLNPDPLAPLNPSSVRPEFTLYRSNGQVVGIINQDMAKDKRCYGQAFELTAGSYYISSSTVLNGWNGTVTLTKTEPNPNAPKFEYGGGIRIQSITFRDKLSNVVRQLNYSYNYTDPALQNGSSGIAAIGNDPEAGTYNDNRYPITYKNVRVSDSQNGWTDHVFSAGDDFYTESNLPQHQIFYDSRNGSLFEKKVYNQNGYLLKHNSYYYSFFGEDITLMFTRTLNSRSGWNVLESKIEREFTVNGVDPIITTESYTYDTPKRLLLSSTFSNSATGLNSRTEITYHTGNSIHTKNRINQVATVQIFKNSQLIATENSNYSNTFASNVAFLPSTKSVAKGASNPVIISRNNRYDEFGHVLETQDGLGIRTSYIYGYNKTLVVAKIVNIAYASIPSSLITAIQAASNLNNNETNLLTALNNLRASASLANTFITTFTHIPMVGVSTITDEKGLRHSFQYDRDRLNVLVSAKDFENNILWEQEYTNTAGFNPNFYKSTIYKQPTTVSIPNPEPNAAAVQMQYFDGVGRLIQSRSIKSTETGKDIVSHHEYHPTGKVTKSYLPFPQNHSYNFSNSAQADLLSYYASGSVNPPREATANPFVETNFEKSPYARPLEIASPGNDWAMNATEKHTIRMAYEFNTVQDAVIRFEANAQSGNATANSTLYTPTLNNLGVFPPNTLYKSIIRNENWKPSDGLNNTSIEFKTIDGKVVLKRVFGESVVGGNLVSENHDTYYVYDQFDNLTYVFPPLINHQQGITTADFNDLAYLYFYDERNRLVAQKEPGKQIQYTLYDNLNRPKAVGPTYNPFSGSGFGWNIIKYDVFSRAVLTAWMSDSTINEARRLSLQTTFNTSTTNLSETKLASTTTTVNNVGFRYSNVSWPTTGYHVLSVNYFDNYSVPTPTNIPVSTALSQAFYNNSILPRALPTSTWVRAVTTATETAGTTSFLFYTRRGFVFRTLQSNFLGGFHNTTNTINAFSGQISEVLTEHKQLASSPVISSTDLFSYSDNSRLLRHFHRMNNNPNQLLTANIYDELGTVYMQYVGGTDITPGSYLQKVDYRYNIRGWLKGINNVNNLQPDGTTVPRDLFAYEIKHQDNQTTSVAAGDVTEQQYNGNISEVFWRSAKDNVVRKYGYKYDKLNRLREAVYQRPGAVNPVRRSYDESAQYDKNGNITLMKRNGEFDDATVVQEIDFLNYTYKPNSNLLLQVVDVTENGNGFSNNEDFYPDEGVDYTYDTFGNLTSDVHKQISSITYNHLNLPLQVLMGTNEIRYIYDGLGNKLAKTTIDRSVTPIISSTTHYLNGFQYQDNVLQFMQIANGYVNCTQVNGTNTYQYVFNYSDHLGNNRVSYTFDPAAPAPGLVILEENNYYPYGLRHRNYNMDERAWMSSFNQPVIGMRPPLIEQFEAPGKHKYKFNGQEWQGDFGYNMYDMPLRDYDPAIGRWVVQDPVIHHSQSTYSSFNGNPVLFADPTGGRGQMLDANGAKMFDNNGNYIWRADRVVPGEVSMAAYGNSGSGATTAPTAEDVKKNEGILVISTVEELLAFLRSNPDVNWGDIDPKKKKKKIQKSTSKEKLIKNTSQALKHYLEGGGSPVRLDNSTKHALRNSPEYRRVVELLISGAAQSLNDDFDVDLTFSVFHVGNTNVRYSTTCKDGNCETKFIEFVNDGFFDVDFIDEKIMGNFFDVDAQKPDGLGPNLERLNGMPYMYIPSEFIIKYKNPGYDE